jgi:hypothetical protein
MKTGILKLAVVIALAVSGISFAGEKEELTLKVQLGQERLARIEAQSIILQRDYEATKAAYQTDNSALQKIVDAEKKVADKDVKNEKR